MVAIWRRAWRSRVSSAARGGDAGTSRGLARPNYGASSSTSGGTILSTTTASSADSIVERPRDFHPLSASVLEENTEELDEERATELEEERVRRLEHMKGLVVEFSGDSLSAVERCLSELDVGWVLRLTDGDAGMGMILVSPQPFDHTGSWIQGLFEISKSVSRCFDGWYSHKEATACPPASEFVRFVEVIFMKMLPFCDAIICLNQQHSIVSVNEGSIARLQALVAMRDALSMTSEQILLSFCSSPYIESTRITDDMRGLLAAGLDKLDDAIWGTMDETGIIFSSTHDDLCSSSTYGTQKSPNVHMVTRSVINYIDVLWIHYWSPDHIPDTCFFENEGMSHSRTNLIVEMVHSLQENLARESEKFSDHSLRFLFLINNYNFMQQHFRTVGLPYRQPFQIEEYIQSYVHASWVPVLKCLHNSTLHCFMRTSPLQKFESQFQKTCTTQKLWKVPDPEMRRRLRKAIIEKVTSSYTRYLEDNSFITPEVTPKEVEETLQELFEG
ncbi:hypothetical protein EJB05_46179, partial [Eragrostis curvula]